jgi:asparagine synthase (glutamine-hydrolysing)
MDFVSPTLVGVPKHRQPVPWLDRGFVRRNRLAFAGYEERLKIFGSLPSFQTNMSTLQTMRRQLACHESGAHPTYVTGYPYLDRSLLEFVYSVPRSQLAGPGRRRLLMRRALSGLVPDAILERRRKAFVIRGPTLALSSEWGRLSALVQHMRSASLGFVNHEVFLATLRKAKDNHNVPLPHVMRTIFLEEWLSNLHRHRLLIDHSPDADAYRREGIRRSAQT